MNDIYLANFQRAQAQFSDQDSPWLNHWRDRAMQNFLTQDFPNRRQEQWKYTDLSFLRESSFDYPEKSENISVDDFAVLPNSYRIVFVNGHFSPELSQLEDLASLVLIRSLRQALVAHPELTKSLLEKEDKTIAPLVAINSAFMVDGLLLQVPKNFSVSKPIHLLHITAKKTAAPLLIAAKNFIVMQENSSATVVEEHVSLDETMYWKNSVMQVTAAAGAKLHYYKIQEENKQAIHYALTEITQQRASEVSSYSFSLGSKLARDDLHFALQDTGAYCRLYGLYLAQQQQHVDHHTRINHQQPHCSSDQFYKGILSDQASGVFNGKVLVHPGAQKTQSQQSNKNLLLSKTAEINTKPELEIYADDVKCTHGATVGQIDETSLFYLQSRGLDRTAAISLLTQAFADDILNKITDELIANYLRSRLRSRDLCKHQP